MKLVNKFKFDRQILKGLMIKDFLQIKDFKIPLLFWTSVSITVSIIFNAKYNLTNLLALMTSFTFGSVVMFSFTFDAQNNGERYIACMPVKRNEIILSKYILSLLTTTVGACIGVIITLIIHWYIYGAVSDINRYIGVGFLGILLMGTLNCIQIPCMYKYGVESSRLITFAIIGILVLLGTGISYLGKSFGIELPLKLLEEFFNKYWSIIYRVLILLVYLISCTISCRMYAVKDI